MGAKNEPGIPAVLNKSQRLAGYLLLVNSITHDRLSLIREERLSSSLLVWFGETTCPSESDRFSGLGVRTPGYRSLTRQPRFLGGKVYTSNLHLGST
jgi:hypothetical protein